MDADRYVLDLYRGRSFQEAFWSGLRAACIALSLIMSSYAMYK